MRLIKQFKISGESGFTMIEGMIAVIIVGLLAIIAVPRIISTDKKLLYATARQITSDMRYARGLAVAKSSDYTVTFKVKDGLPPGETQYEVMISDSSGIVIKSLDLSKKVILCEPDEADGLADPFVITFSILGNTTAPDGPILDLKVGNYKYRISVVGATGMVYEEELV